MVVVSFWSVIILPVRENRKRSPTRSVTTILQDDDDANEEEERNFSLADRERFCSVPAVAIAFDLDSVDESMGGWHRSISRLPAS
jgi:hypothetical protein